MRVAVLAIAAVALLAMACANGDDDQGTTPTETAAVTESPPTSTAAASPTPLSEATAKIAFACGPPSDDICVVNADGTDFVNLTNTPNVSDFLFRWSPDGTRIAFMSDRDGNDEIYVMGVDGSDLTNLTNSPANEGSFDWSPDGLQIAFVSDRDGSRGIYRMAGDGSGVRRLTDAGLWGPVWSPDGSRIAFAAANAGQFYDVYVMNADGSGRTRVTGQIADTEREGLPFAWSPDGTHIVIQGVTMRNTDLYLINADGSGLISLTRSADMGRDPVWSPDGSRIAFWSDSGISVIGPDGSGLIRLTGAAALLPGWSPDGSRIAFISSRDGNGELYVMNADGSEQTRLTNTPDDEYAPAWQPRP